MTFRQRNSIKNPTALDDAEYLQTSNGYSIFQKVDHKNRPVYQAAAKGVRSPVEFDLSCIASWITDHPVAA